MGPGALEQVLLPFAAHHHPRLLVGLQTADDAAVYQLTEDQAVIQTVDFFPPIVDDPYLYGQIAAANAMSDIFAMGGAVALALNIAGFPASFPVDVISEIFAGGADKVAEAGGVIAGGHSIVDAEPKYGLSVTGFIHPDRIMRKGRLSPGDVLILTKPIGTGVLTTRARAEDVQSPHLTAAIESMVCLNRAAAGVASSSGLVAATDITGFGLLGHASEMARASGAHVRFRADVIPLLDGAREAAIEGYLPGGVGRNRDHFQHGVDVVGDVDSTLLDLLYDPETSGGLLLGVPQDRLSLVETRMKDAGQPFWVVAVVEPADATSDICVTVDGSGATNRRR